jgi:hypothetical protein
MCLFVKKWQSFILLLDIPGRSVLSRSYDFRLSAYPSQFWAILDEHVYLCFLEIRRRLAPSAEQIHPPPHLCVFMVNSASGLDCERNPFLLKSSKQVLVSSGLMKIGAGGRTHTCAKRNSGFNDPTQMRIPSGLDSVWSGEVQRTDCLLRTTPTSRDPEYLAREAQ